MGSLVRNIYDGFTENDIATRSTLSGTTIVKNGDGTVSFSKCNMSAIRNMLGTGLNTVAGNDNSSNVNQWSGFGPVVRSISGGSINLTNAAGGKMGHFLGYDHAAPTPSVTARDTSRTFFSTDTTKSITAFVDLGEVAWYAETGARYLALEIYQSDGTTLVGRATYDLSTRSSQGTLLSYDYDVSSKSADFSLKARVIFMSTSPTFLAYMVGESAMYDVDFTYIPPPTVSMFLPGNSPWSTYTLYTGTLSASVLSNTETINWGVDTNGDSTYDAVYGYLYVTDGTNYWVWNNGTSAWETWNFSNNTPPATSYRILTSAGVYTSFSETSPFTVQNGQSIVFYFGDLPKTLL